MKNKRKIGISSQQMQCLLNHFDFDFLINSTALEKGIRYYKIYDDMDNVI